MATLSPRDYFASLMQRAYHIDEPQDGVHDAYKLMADNVIANPDLGADMIAAIEAVLPTVTRTIPSLNNLIRFARTGGIMLPDKEGAWVKFADLQEAKDNELPSVNDELVCIDRDVLAAVLEAEDMSYIRRKLYGDGGMPEEPIAKRSLSSIAVYHINGNNLDNSFGNLQLVDPKENKRIP